MEVHIAREDARQYWEEQLSEYWESGFNTALWAECQREFSFTNSEFTSVNISGIYGYTITFFAKSSCTIKGAARIIYLGGYNSSSGYITVSVYNSYGATSITSNHTKVIYDIGTVSAQSPPC